MMNSLLLTVFVSLVYRTNGKHLQFHNILVLKQFFRDDCKSLLLNIWQLTYGHAKELIFTAEMSGNARTLGTSQTMATPVTYIFIHHTVTPQCYTVDECKAAVRNVQDIHMDGNGKTDLLTNYLMFLP